MPTIKNAITQINSRIFYLDSRQVNSFGVSGIYFIIGDGITLIETGTTLIAPYILEAVAEIGYQEKDIARAIVTHIHLDHSGGTGWLVRHLPRMQVYVHERGLKHLQNPSKLIDSAKMVYGDLNSILTIHGEILPVAGENLFPIADSELEIGDGIKLEIIDTPGHASHHLCIFEADSGCLFSGEALGHYHPETDTLQPAVAPPAFDFEASKKTIRKIRDLNPHIVCFSQFGQHNDSVFIIEEAERQLQMYYEAILERLKQGMGSGEIIAELTELNSQGKEGFESLVQGMLISVVAGYQTYFQRQGMLN